MRRTTALLNSAAVLLAACGAGTSSSTSAAWFPLDAGHVWTYRVTVENDSAVLDRDTLTLRALGRDELADGPAWHRASDSGVHYWLRSDDSGIYRIATRSDLDAEPKVDASRRYVLKAPYTVGTSWQAHTTAYLLARRAEFPREIRHTHPSIPMNYTIEATQQTVNAAGQRHEGCLRVRGSAQVRLYADPVVGWKDMPLSTLEWYCPGVGLVRLERDEPAQSSFLDGGKLTMELVSWSRG
jgi:hypothetical protein